MEQRTHFSLITNYIYLKDSFRNKYIKIPFNVWLNKLWKSNLYWWFSFIFRLDKNVYILIKNKLGYSLLEMTSYQIEFEKFTLNNYGLYQDLFNKYDYWENIFIKPNKKFNN